MLASLSLSFSSPNRNWLISWTWYTIWSTQRETSEERGISVKFSTLKSLMSVQISGSTLFNVLQVTFEFFLFGFLSLEAP